jgi:putative membrane protein
MSNRKLIESARLVAIAVLLLSVVIAAAESRRPVSNSIEQNSNDSKSQNSNSNRNSSNENSANHNTMSGGTASVSSQDQKFITATAMDGMMEVELGRLATQKGMSDSVKQFGQRMVDDHSLANTELMQLANSKGITLPTALDTKHRNEIDKFSKLSGAEFDRAYAKAMLKDHEKAVSNFQKESTRAGDVDLKAFASKTLPTLQDHLQMARALGGNQQSTKMKTDNANR